jgi:hypothetical protein
MKLSSLRRLLLIVLACVAPAASTQLSAGQQDELVSIRIETTRPTMPIIVNPVILQMPHVDLPRPELPKGAANKPRFHDLIVTLPLDAVAGFQQWFAETQAGTAEKVDVYLIGFTSSGARYPLLHMRGCVPTLLDVARPFDTRSADRVAIAFESIVYDVPQN